MVVELARRSLSGLRIQDLLSEPHGSDKLSVLDCPRPGYLNKPLVESIHEKNPTRFKLTMVETATTS